MAEYGSGPTLDRFWDFSVGSSGDIKSTDDIDEVQKDVAFRVASVLRHGRGVTQPETVSDGLLGEPLRSGVLSDAQIAVAKVIDQGDPRIESVEGLSVSVADEQFDAVVVDANLFLQTGSIDFEQVVPL